MEWRPTIFISFAWKGITGLLITSDVALATMDFFLNRENKMIEKKIIIEL